MGCVARTWEQGLSLQIGQEHVRLDSYLSIKPPRRLRHAPRKILSLESNTREQVRSVAIHFRMSNNTCHRRITIRKLATSCEAMAHGSVWVNMKSNVGGCLITLGLGRGGGPSSLQSHIVTIATKRCLAERMTWSNAELATRWMRLTAPKVIP